MIVQVIVKNGLKILGLVLYAMILLRWVYRGINVCVGMIIMMMGVRTALIVMKGVWGAALGVCVLGVLVK